MTKNLTGYCLNGGIKCHLQCYSILQKNVYMNDHGRFVLADVSVYNHICVGDSDRSLGRRFHQRGKKSVASYARHVTDPAWTLFSKQKCKKAQKKSLLQASRAKSEFHPTHTSGVHIETALPSANGIPRYKCSSRQ